MCFLVANFLLTSVSAMTYMTNIGRNADGRINGTMNWPTACKNLVNFGPVTVEILTHLSTTTIH